MTDDAHDTRLRQHTVEMLFNLKQELDGIATHNLQDLRTYVGVMSIPNVGRTKDSCWQLLYELAEAKLAVELLEMEAGEVTG